MSLDQIRSWVGELPLGFEPHQLYTAGETNIEYVAASIGFIGSHGNN